MWWAMAFLVCAACSAHSNDYGWALLGFGMFLVVLNGMP